MQQIFKSSHAFKWLLSMLVSTVIFVACNNEAPKTETPIVDSTTKTAAPVDTIKAVVDSLPPIDTTARSRPETRKAKP